MSRNVESTGNRGVLALVRHGTSEGNEQGRWAGRVEFNLAAPQGYNDAAKVAGLLREEGFFPDRVYSSPLQRTRQMTALLEQELTTTVIDHGDAQQPATLSKPFKLIVADELAERDFGIYGGRKKSEVREEIGEEEYLRLRRGGWDVAMPGGQSMKDVDRQVGPYLRQEVLPHVLAGEKVLFVAHSNIVRVSLRNIHELDPVEGEAFPFMEINHGEVHFLEFESDGGVYDQKILGQPPIDPVEPEEVPLGRAFIKKHSTELDS